MSSSDRTIWTIGHSTRTGEQFLELLRGQGIELLVDIRSYPGSRRYPHFNKEHLAHWLPEHGIEYIHMVGLGGRRQPVKNSPNVAWRHPAFRGYADYMLTDAFQHEIEVLEKRALEKRLAYMCSEAPWWKCHRSLVSDYLKISGWRVLHIMEGGKTTEHPYTSAAKIQQGQLFYSEP